jgi:hypothetical protein
MIEEKEEIAPEESVEEEQVSNYQKENQNQTPINPEEKQNSFILSEGIAHQNEGGIVVRKKKLHWLKNIFYPTNFKNGEINLVGLSKEKRKELDGKKVKIILEVIE